MRRIQAAVRRSSPWSPCERGLTAQGEGRTLSSGGDSCRAPSPEPRAPSPEPRAPSPEPRAPSPVSQFGRRSAARGAAQARTRGRGRRHRRHDPAAAGSANQAGDERYRCRGPVRLGCHDTQAAGVELAQVRAVCVAAGELSPSRGHGRCPAVCVGWASAGLHSSSRVAGAAPSSDRRDHHRRGHLCRRGPATGHPAEGSPADHASPGSPDGEPEDSLL